MNRGGTIASMRAPAPIPASGLLHPVPVLAIVLLAANDHVFKQQWPGLVTGKLSDVAGLAFFPLLLQAAWELITRTPPSRRVLLACAGLTGLVFALVNVWTPADEAYRFALGAMQWIARGEFVRIGHVSDAADLLALPALALAIAAGWDRGPAGR